MTLESSEIWADFILSAATDGYFWDTQSGLGV